MNRHLRAGKRSDASSGSKRSFGRELAAVLFAAGLVVGISTYGLVDQIAEPHCPTEDSCEIDYDNGQWKITEVTP